MVIFFICQRVPFPPNRGDKITTFNEIRYLAKNHEVHVFCLADGPGDLENVPALREYVASVTAFAVTPLAVKLRSLKAFITGRPLSVEAFNVKSLHDSIKKKHAELRPDLIFAYSCNMAQYADHFSHLPRIMQFADLDSLKWAQFAQRSAIPLKWAYGVEAKRLLSYERYIGNNFSHALVCTSNERHDFTRLIPGVPVSVVGNGVDLEFFRSQGRPKKPASLVFTGIMDYLPNVDAMVWFCEQVLPLVQREVPGANLVICGSNPTAAVRRLQKRAGVVVTGHVPETRPFIDSAEVCVVPLRMGRGIPNKVLEALAMAVPCVTTTAAWSGTVVPNGEGIITADDARGFADHVIRLLAEHTYRAEMATKARKSAERFYTWNAQMQCLDRVIAGLVGDRLTSFRSCI